MTDTPNLVLPYILAAQAQKHVTHNEAIRALDCLVQLSVADRDLAAPPASPANGARYLVAAGASGAWSGQSGRIAAYQDGAWVFYQPRAGWLAWVEDENIAIVNDDGAWTTLGGGGGGVTDHGALTGLGDDDHTQYLNNARGDARYTPINPTTLGVNATADTTNRLAVSSAATLLNHAGAGHQVKVNKNAAGDTASFLFQTAFSGRAEMGTTGDDDFHFKVSNNGSTWYEAMKIDRTNGRVSFPSGGVREKLTANRTYYVRTDGSNSNNGLANTSGGAFLTKQYAADYVCNNLDLSGYAVTIQVADGTYAGGISFSQPWTGGGSLIIQGNTTTPANVVCSAASLFTNTANLPGGVTVQGFKHTGSGQTILANGVGTIKVSALEFASTGFAHMQAGVPGAIIAVTGNCSVTAAASYHCYCSGGGFIQRNIAVSPTITLTGTLAFTGFVNASYMSQIKLDSVTYDISGATVTGQRYSASLNSVIATNGGGASYFPGSTAGATATGAQYV